MRIKCDRCERRRKVEAVLTLTCGDHGFVVRAIKRLCRACYFELMLPDSLDMLLRRALKGGK